MLKQYMFCTDNLLLVILLPLLLLLHILNALLSNSINRICVNLDPSNIMSTYILGVYNTAFSLVFFLTKKGHVNTLPRIMAMPYY